MHKSFIICRGGFYKGEYNAHGYCDVGYQGKLCNDCETGYAKTGRCLLLDVFNILQMVASVPNVEEMLVYISNFLPSQ